MTAVLFDLYGVLVHNHDREAQRALEDVVGWRGDRFWRAYWDLRPAYDAGQPAERYWAAVADALGGPVPDVPTAVLADAAGWTEPHDDVVELLTSLRARGVPVGILSNIPRELRLAVEERHQSWLPGDDWVTWSSDHGVVKPDPASFQLACARMQLDPSDVLFVDDRQENVAAATATGMTAHQFTSYTGLVRAVGAFLAGQYRVTVPSSSSASIPGSVTRDSEAS